MRHWELHRNYMPGAAILLAGALTLSGCVNGSHPDDAAAIHNNFASNDLRSVTVHQDRKSGVITLTGIVATPNQKTQAEEIAKQSAPGYSINNKLQVGSPELQGIVQQAAAKSETDHAIENRFKESIKAHKNLESRQIQCSASNGTLYLKGAVKTAQEKKEAEQLARKVPNVQNVINDIQVIPGKPSPANS